jgi:hypothetical protein
MNISYRQHSTLAIKDASVTFPVRSVSGLFLLRAVFRDILCYTECVQML